MLKYFAIIGIASFLLLMSGGGGASADPIESRDLRRNVEEYDPETIANALAFLEELERRHGYFARPR